VVRHLARSGHATRFETWACYHSELWLTARGGLQIGVVPCAVGAPYAVLVAEELHASGCNLVISVTSAGRILPIGDPPCFLLIERRGAMRARACTTSRLRNGPNCGPNSASG
jgi:uridine phosphorylase